MNSLTSLLFTISGSFSVDKRVNLNNYSSSSLKSTISKAKLWGGRWENFQALKFLLRANFEDLLGFPRQLFRLGAGVMKIYGRYTSVSKKFCGQMCQL